MQGVRSQVQLQDFGTKLPVDLLKRLRLEARRSGQSIRAVIAAALDSYLPREVKFTIVRK